MNGQTMVVAIIFILVVGAVFILQQVKSLRMPPANSDDDEIKLRQQVEDLEQRVRTLERIATDGKKTLKEEIDTL